MPTAPIMILRTPVGTPPLSPGHEFVAVDGLTFNMVLRHIMQLIKKHLCCMVTGFFSLTNYPARRPARWLIGV